MMRPMDTKNLIATIDGLLAQLKAGDTTAIERIVAVYNSRTVAPGTVLVQGWNTIIR